MINAIFLFHLVILLLIVVYVMMVRESAEKFLLGFYLLLFTLHCALWGSTCTLCDLASPVCLIEVVLFWAAFAIYLIYKKVARS